MEAIYEKWEQILQFVKEEHDISQVSFDTWLKPLEICTIKDGKLYILVPSAQLGVKYIARKYELPIKVAITEMTGMEYELIFILPEQAKQLRNKTAKKQTSASDAGEHSNLNPNYTFDTFVVGGNNRFAQSAALAVAESPGDVYNPLYLYGGAGLGKTHLMHSIGRFILEQNPNMKVLYVTSEVFTNEVIDGIRSGDNIKMNKFREKYRTVDVLLIDDIQFIIGKESTQEEFFHTFNTLHSAGKQIILSSDKPPKDMEILEERFRSRFEWGLIADIQPPDYETRMAILKKNAETYPKEIEDEVFQYIANNIKSNIRELEGALRRVVAHSQLLSDKEITLDMTQDVLKDMLRSFDKRTTIDEIQKKVAEHFNISVKEMQSSRRARTVARPRQIAMYLAKQLTSRSLPEIGRKFDRDHTTVMHAVRKVEELILEDASLAENVDALRRILES